MFSPGIPNYRDIAKLGTHIAGRAFRKVSPYIARGAYRGVSSLASKAVTSLGMAVGRYGFRKYRSFRGGGGGRNYVPYKLKTGRGQAMVKGKTRRTGFYGRYPGAFNSSILPYNPELKFFDTSVLDAATASAGTLLPAGGSLNIIPSGVTQSARIGRRMTVVHIRFSGAVGLPASGSSSQNSVCRLILYLDKQCNGAVVIPTDLIDVSGAENPVYSARTVVNQGRFRFLFDKIFMMNVIAAGGNGTTNFTLPLDKHFLMERSVSIPLEFSGITGGISEIATNNLGVLAFSIGGASIVTFAVRLRFSDS